MQETTPMTSFGPIVRPGMIMGTTNLSPLSMLIKKFKPGPFQMFNQNVCSHIALSVLWSPEYAKCIVNAAKAWGCAPRIPDVPAGSLLGIEATWPRCRWFRLDHYAMARTSKPHYVFVTQPLNRARSVDEINRFIWSYAGKPYELAVFLQPYGIPSSDTKDKTAYCSEIAHELLNFTNTTHEAAWQYGVPPIDIQLHFEACHETLWKCYTGNWYD